MAIRRAGSAAAGGQTCAQSWQQSPCSTESVPNPQHPLVRRHNLNLMGGGDATLLMVHGYGCNQAMWRHLAPRLADGWRVALMDLAGFGHSDHGCYEPGRYDRLRGHAEDVAGVALLLAEEQPVVLVGHSVGATVAMLADRLQPQAAVAHVMVAPSPCFMNQGDYRGGFDPEALRQLLAGQANGREAWAREVAMLVAGEAAWGPLASELAESFCRAEPRAALQLAHDTFLGDHRAELAGLRKPTLLLQASQDPIAPPEVGEFMHRQIPRSVLQTVVGRDHCPQITQAAACAEAIRSFMQGLALPAATGGAAPRR